MTHSPRRRAFKRSLIGVVVVAGLVGGGELLANFGLGLGDPPLYEPHPTIGYLNKPGTYHRFGNRVHINDHHMRCADFPADPAPNESRVMLLGDSVIHGGSLTDQADIAASRLQRRLAERAPGPVTVGNACAGGWSPANMLAYVQQFGFFEADVIVFVLSSHDYASAPVSMPTNPNFPTDAPPMALVEGIDRYLPRYWDHLFGPNRTEAQTQSAAQNAVERPEKQAVTRAAQALNQLFEMAKATGAEVLLAQHLTSAELRGEIEHPGFEAIRRIAHQAGIETFSLGPAFGDAIESGLAPYRDDIHPSAVGQRVIAEALEPRIREGLGQRGEQPHDAP